jgi:pimeloyl-ACP methyl ester carboxylesterase
VYVAVEGTVSLAQWVGNVLLSNQAAFPGIAGKVHSFFGACAANILTRIGPSVGAALTGRRVVFLGHSLGGAVVQCLAAAVGPVVPRLILTAGSPRVGNRTFADSFAPGELFRIENSDDPIPSIPPVLWVGPGSVFPVPGFGLPDVYVHAGEHITVLPDGRWTFGFSPRDSVLRILAVLGGRLSVSHTAQEYARRNRYREPTGVLS